MRTLPLYCGKPQAVTIGAFDEKKQAETYSHELKSAGTARGSTAFNIA
jgi:hypothetical protein